MRGDVTTIRLSGIFAPLPLPLRGSLLVTLEITVDLDSPSRRKLALSARFVCGVDILLSLSSFIRRKILGQPKLHRSTFNTVPFHYGTMHYRSL
jgi:hypothetical protein